MFDAEYEGGGTANTGGIVDTVILGVVLVEITVVTVDLLSTCE